MKRDKDQRSGIDDDRQKRGVRRSRRGDGRGIQRMRLEIKGVREILWLAIHSLVNRVRFQWLLLEKVVVDRPRKKNRDRNRGEWGERGAERMSGITTIL